MCWSIISTIASLLLAVIAFATLCWQYCSNKRQKFENHFFELLRIHRQNVEEMKMGNLEKREIFKGLYYEFCSYVEIINNYLDVSSNKQIIDNAERINLAYKIFFYGNEFNNTWNELGKLVMSPIS